MPRPGRETRRLQQIGRIDVAQKFRREHGDRHRHILEILTGAETSDGRKGEVADILIGGNFEYRHLHGFGRNSGGGRGSGRFPRRRSLRVDERPQLAGEQDEDGHKIAVESKMIRFFHGILDAERNLRVTCRKNDATACLTSLADGRRGDGRAATSLFPAERFLEAP